MKAYIKPEVEEILFVTEEVTTMSGGVDETFDWGDGWDE